MRFESTLYELLEVSPHSSVQVIRAAYRCLTQSNHPDKNPGAAAAIERQAQLNHAYAVLSDPRKRRRYDQTMGLQDHRVERRGSMAAKQGRTPSGGASEAVSRAFVFRPFT